MNCFLRALSLDFVPNPQTISCPIFSSSQLLPPQIFSLCCIPHLIFFPWFFSSLLGRMNCGNSPLPPHLSAGEFFPLCRSCEKDSSLASCLFPPKQGNYPLRCPSIEVSSLIFALKFRHFELTPKVGAWPLKGHTRSKTRPPRTPKLEPAFRLSPWPRWLEHRRSTTRSIPPSFPDI